MTHAPHTRTAPLVRGGMDVPVVKPFLQEDLVATDVLVQAGSTALWGWDIHNTTAAIAFVVFYDAAAVSDVAVGTTVPDYIVPLIASGDAASALRVPIEFKLGMVIASLTTTDGSTGAASDVSLQYS